ncbi:MAG: transketolase [Alphaproteobacteria bacterium]|nr:transketolase [Alphaproteobacteria bacterium]
MPQQAHNAVVKTIKGLAMDAVQAANSGHPGMPMGAADMATVLWTRFLKFDPKHPEWPDRDRFVLSAGHGSMLLYSLLHLAGFDVTLDDIKSFRQWGSRTPGHPEVGHTPGVETTTGPLGQGFAMGVGMAFAERYLRETFGADLCDHWTYGIVSDGDLMEGISSESASIAGHLKLSRIIYLYDDNSITIDGGTEISFTEDVGARLAAMGWHVQRVDGHDPDAIAKAIANAKETDHPSLICCRTVIGQGSPKYAGTSDVHGKALGAEEVAATKRAIGLDPDAFFAVLPGAREAFTPATSAREAWEARLAAHPDADRFKAFLARDGAAAIAKTAWPAFEAGKGVATRKSSEQCLKAIVQAAPWVIGGSADLAGSNGTKVGAAHFTPDRFGGAGTIDFGVREHAMGAICNGIALHGGAVPYGATFLMFHDYQRPALRLAALMHQQVLYIYTHDSVFLGEDGPTHQPISTLLALRAVPNVRVWRPADALETVAAWKAALLNKTGPTALILTRQNLPTLTAAQAADAGRGGYVVSDCDGTPDVVLMGTGSEVETCVDAQKVLAGKGVAARVVSLPCRELFLEQGEAWVSSVLPAGVPRLSVEAGVTLGWERWVGANGASHGIDTFGYSAPAEVIAEKLGFTGAGIADRALALIGRA